MENVVLYWRHCIRVRSCHYFVYQKLLNIKLTCVVRGMLCLFHMNCLKSVGIYKHKVLRIKS